MGLTSIIMILASIAFVVGIGVLAYFLLGTSGGGATQIRDLMVTGRRADIFAKGKPKTDDLDEIEAIKKRTGSAKAGVKSEDIGTKLFKAGYYSSADRKRFLQIRIISFVVVSIFLPFMGYMAFGTYEFVAIGTVLGMIIGFALPMSWLERQIRAREEDIMYFLPLAIEQISIGVSSSLDVGPCISHIINMAYERESLNPVTEMFVHVEKLIRSGLNLEDALIEVGDASGLPEVKHAFMFLSQCAKHGGEVRKQLQELADAVMMQRQVNIEGKIAQLPVKATGPLAMVFAGFFALLFSGLVVRLMSAFGGDSG